MPSLDAYQGLQFDDEDGIEVWLLAHRFRHTTYDNAMIQAGFPVANYHIGGYPDDTWFNDHANAHYGYQQLVPPDQSTSISVLTDYTWDNDSDFQTWMQMHTLIHRRLDEAFRIF